MIYIFINYNIIYKYKIMFKNFINNKSVTKYFFYLTFISSIPSVSSIYLYNKYYINNDLKYKKK